MSYHKSVAPNNNTSMAEISSFEKAVMSNVKQSIEKHLSHMKLDQQQLNYALFLCISNYRTDEHTDQCFLMLLRHKANPNCQINEQTPLISACQKGQASLVRLLLQYGAKPDLLNEKSEVPLEVVLLNRRQNYDVAQAIINALPTVNMEIRGKMPIVLSVEREYFRIFQMLIEKGASLLYQNQNILHIILKKKFTRKSLKRKFLKQLAGRGFLIQEDMQHRFPLQYEENQQIKNYCFQLFKPKSKINKQEPIQTPTKTRVEKEKVKQITKHIKEHQLTKQKQTKKKNKDLDVSFSELDEEQYNEDKDQMHHQEKLSAVIQSLDEQQKHEEDRQDKEQDKEKVKSKTHDMQKQKQKNKEKSVQLKINTKLSQCEKQVLKNSASENKIIGKPLLNQTKIQEEIPNKQQVSHINFKTQILNTTGNNSNKKWLHKSFHNQITKKKGQKQKIKYTKKLSQDHKKKEKNLEHLIEYHNGHQQKIIPEIEQIVDKNVRSETVVQNIFKNNCEDIKLLENQKAKQKNISSSSQEQEEDVMFSKTSLNEQILNFSQQVAYQTEKMLQLVKSVINCLRELIINSLKAIINSEIHLQILVYGSQSTGLAVIHSDIDLMIVSSVDYDYLMRILSEKRVFESSEIQHAKFINNASMPVIKLQMGRKYRNLKVDLTFNMRNHMGLRCSEFLNQFIAMEPVIKPLVLFLKTLVHSYGLSDPYTGGIGSYSIALLVIALLQCTSKPRDLESLSDLLLQFFQLYGEELNYISQAIIIYHLHSEYRQHPMRSIYQLPPSSVSYSENLVPKLVIYDPLNPVNNVSRSSYRVVEIKRLFSICYTRLRMGAHLQDLLDASFTEVIHGDDGIH